MAINLDQIRQRLQQMQQASGGNKASEFIWKPTVGKTQVRVVQIGRASCRERV